MGGPALLCLPAPAPASTPSLTRTGGATHLQQPLHDRAAAVVPNLRVYAVVGGAATVVVRTITPVRAYRVCENGMAA